MSEVTTRLRTCDQCGADLTHTTGSYNWHFVLKGEFTPSTSNIGYDPHPTPPKDRHFCDQECLSTWSGHAFDAIEISYKMFDVGGKMLAETGAFGSIGNYAEQRKLAIKLFKAMWLERPSSLGSKSRNMETI